MKTELLAIEALNVTFHSKTGPKPLVKKLGSGDSKRQSGSVGRRRIW